MSTQKPILPGLEGSGVSTKPTLPGLEVKKKEFSEEQLAEAETSLRGYSVAPQELESEVPSTQVDEKDLAKEKITSDIKGWYEERGGLTPQDKYTNFNKDIIALKGDYETRIKENPQAAQSLIQEYNTKLDETANKYGLIKEEGGYTITPNDKKVYQEVVERYYKNYIKDLSKKEQNDPFFKKLGLKLSAGSDRFLNIPMNVMAISEAITNAVSEKVGGGTNTYWQDRAALLSNKANEKSQKAKIGEGEIVSALQEGKIGEAAGNLALDIAEQVPQLLTLWAGNAAGITNASLGLIGTQVGTEKFVQNKELGVPDWMNAINSITSAGIEITTEAIGTIPLFDNMNRAIRNKGADVAKQEISKALRTPMQRAYATVVGGVTPMVREASSEVAAELSSQIVDKYTINPDVEIGEGLADIAVSSAVIGKILSTPTDFMTRKTREQIKEAYNQVPEEYTAANKLEATELILKIDELEEVSKKTNDVLGAKYKSKIEDLNNQLLDIANREDKATEITEQIDALDQEIALQEEEGKDTKKLEVEQQKLIDEKEKVLSGELQEDVEALKRADVDAAKKQKEVIEKSLIKEKGVEDEIKTPEKPLEAKIEEKEQIIPKEGKVEEKTQKEPKIETKEKLKKEEDKDALQQELQKEVEDEAVQEEIIDKKEEVEPYKTKEDFKKDFLSDDANLENIDVPLKMKDKIAAAKNLREGKQTKQAEMLESYLDESFERGQLSLITADKKTRTAAPLTSILQIQEAPTTEVPKTKQRVMGQKALESKVFNPEVQEKIKKHGIDYFVRGDDVVTAEANEIAKIYHTTGNRDGLKALILDRSNNIKGDARTELSVAYAEETQKLADKAKTQEEKKAYEQDIADVYISEMEAATEVARDLRSKARWQRVLQNNPNVVVEYKKRQVNKENKEFLDKNKEDIKTTKQVIDEYLASDDFKKKVREAVKLEKGESIAKRRERGKQKIASGLDKLANISGVKKNFVADNDVDANKSQIVDAVTELASGILDLGVANIEDLIHKIKIQTREFLSPSVIDDIKDEVIKATDAENKLEDKKLTAKDVVSDKDIKKVVDKIYAKALKAKRSDLKRILLESIDIILEEGSIDSDAFQELYAKAAGKPYVDAELSKEIRESQETINDARKIRNNIESLLDEAIAETKKDNPDQERIKRLEEQIKVQQKEYKEAYRKAEKANANLSRIFAPEMTGAQRLSSGVQAGLMTFSTFVLNPLANMVSTIPRTLKMYIEWGLDYGMYGLGTIKENWLDKLDREKYPTLYRTISALPDPTMTRNAPAFSKYYFKNIPLAVKQSFQDVLTGQTPDDAFVREIARGLHPMDAAIRVYERLTGKRKREFGKLLGDMWEASLGVYAEGVFRLLNLGDKPFRIPAMLARLNEIATIKKLKGLEREKFLLNPDEDSLNDAVQTGLESTFQQTTKASQFILKMKNWGNDLPSDNPLSKVAKGFATLFTTTQIPFVKTLVNIANEGAKYTFPWYSGILGTRDVLRGNRKGALDNYSKAIVANIIGMGIAELMATGLMTLGRGGREEEDDEYSRKKVEKAEYVGDYGANRLNVTGTLRYLAGGDPEWRDDDITINYQGLGILGVAASAKAEAYRGLSPEEIKEQAWYDYTLGMAWGTLQGVTEQPFFTGPATFLRAFTEGGYALDNWAQNTLSALRSAVVPNTYVAINKYRDNRIREVREKYLEQTKSKGWKEVQNRLISDLKPDSDLPIKISIYGEDVERYKDKQLWNLFDPLKIKRHESDFAFKIFDLYNRTKDESVFPSYPKASIKDKDISNDYVKLDSELYNKYAKTLLSFKATILKAVVNSADWEQMSDNDRVDVLKKIHDMYMRKGEAGYIMKKVFIAQNYEELKELAEKQKQEKEKLSPTND